MLAWATVARALEPDAIDVARFRPALDPYGYAATESAAPLGHLEVLLGAWGGLESGVAVPADGALDRRLGLDLQLGLGLGRRFSVVAAAPVVLDQAGVASDGAPLPARGVGDLRLAPKLALVDRGPVGIALLATATLPFATLGAFGGEGTPTVAPMVVVEAADGAVRTADARIRGALNLGARFASPGDDGLGTELLGRAAVSVRPVRPLEVGSDLVAVSASDLADTPIEWLPWVRLHGGTAFSLTAGAGLALHSGLGAPDYRLLLGLVLAPTLDRSARDRDRDGIANLSDLCPAEPEDRDGARDDDGCPDDDDQDGIADRDDACPAEAEDLVGNHTDGCPEHDDDTDGVPDTVDRCIDRPEDRDGFEDLDGCPDPDNDGDHFPDRVDPCPLAADVTGCPADWSDADADGVPDASDVCPSALEDVDAHEDDDGCPDPDNDGDQIPDEVDVCPFEAENRDGLLDDDGCVDAPPERVQIAGDAIRLLEPISFGDGDAVLDPASVPVLDALAVLLRAHPELVRVSVEGHTSDEGSAAANLKLTRARAEAVIAWLVRAGVAPERLVAKGFGESLPIDTNDTARGRTQNRRVEFTILEQRSVPASSTGR